MSSQRGKNVPVRVAAKEAHGQLVSPLTDWTRAAGDSENCQQTHNDASCNQTDCLGAARASGFSGQPQKRHPSVLSAAKSR